MHQLSPAMTNYLPHLDLLHRFVEHAIMDNKNDLELFNTLFIVRKSKEFMPMIIFYSLYWSAL